MSQPASTLYMPKMLLKEPVAVPDTFTTGLEAPYVTHDFARLIFWTAHPDFSGEVTERQTVMPINTLRMMRRVILLFCARGLEISP
jgi:hypothetical protein